MAIKETFDFDKEKYAAKLKTLTPDQLREREITKYRQHITSGWSVGVSSLLTVPTLGGALVGLGYSSRRLHISRRKLKMIENELDRRNLAHYKRQKKDVWIPIAVCSTVTGIGITIDLLCFGMTSTAIVHAVADHGLTAISSAVHHPHAFADGASHGFGLQMQQFFGGGGHHASDLVSQTGLNAVHQTGLNAPIPVQGTDGVKAVLSSAMHNHLAAGGSAHAAAVMHTEANIVSTNANYNNDAALAGLALGMTTAQAVEKQVAQEIVNESNAAYAFRYPGTDIRSQTYIESPPGKACTHLNTGLDKPKCHFCEVLIDTATEPYYHCCGCQGPEDDFQICHNCMKVLACGCPRREEHVLHRIGVDAEDARSVTTVTEDQQSQQALAVDLKCIEKITVVSEDQESQEESSQNLCSESLQALSRLTQRLPISTSSTSSAISASSAPSAPSAAYSAPSTSSPLISEPLIPEPLIPEPLISAPSSPSPLVSDLKARLMIPCLDARWLLVTAYPCIGIFLILASLLYQALRSYI